MKRIALITCLVFALALTSFARKPVAEGKTHTSYGDFKVQLDNTPLTINGKNHLPYVIKYENSDMVVRVAIDYDRNTKKYYVISDGLCIQYVSNKKYFGVEKLAKETEKDGYVTSDTYLNRNEYYRQRIITSGKNWRTDNTDLVAAYFPLLLENSTNKLAAK